MTIELAPWQLWWTDFDPQVGREQAGLRPAIVVGTTFACLLPNDLVFLVPCTTTDRSLPFQPRIALKRPTFAMCDQLTSVSRLRLRRPHPEPGVSAQDIATIKFVLRQMIEVR